MCELVVAVGVSFCCVWWSVLLVCYVQSNQNYLLTY